MCSIETPEWATNYMFDKLGKDVRRQYADISNAHLELLPGLTQPAWVIELYDRSQVTAIAVLEPPCKKGKRYFYIVYDQTINRQQIIDREQVYDAPVGGYEARIFSNAIEEVCVEWV